MRFVRWVVLDYDCIEARGEEVRGREGWAAG